MAKYLDLTGLTYFLSKITANFVAKETGKGLSSNDFTTAEKTKLTGIETGAQANVIDTVKVNGTTLTVTNKAVDVTVPTATSDLTNDSGFLDSSDFKTINNESIAGSGNIAITGLPSVTSSDNGKVLRVTNGTWSVVALPSASGVNF